MRYQIAAGIASIFLFVLAGCASTNSVQIPDRSPVIAEPRMRIEKSPNFTEAARTSDDIDTIVIHTTEGNYRDYLSFEENQRIAYHGTIIWFLDTKSQVSAHYVISPTGEITRMVDPKDIAWHATYYNKRSIGIENAGWARRKETWTPELLNSLVDLTAYLCVKYAVEPVHPDSDAVKDGGYFNGTGIVGHYQIQTAGSKAVEEEKLGLRTDPGEYFPWETFIKRVQARVAEIRGR